MKVGRLLLRATVGGFFIGHGTQKLFGLFGGEGLKGTAAGFHAMGLKPGNVNALAAGIAETAGGAGVALGYQTPFASAALVSVMATAINRVHLKNGPWAHKGGYEYNAVLLAAAVALAESGPGALSLDALRGKQREGAGWGLVALGLGAAGAAGAHFFIEQKSVAAATDAASHNGTGDAAAVSTEAPTEVHEPVNGNGVAEPVEPVAETEAADADADAEA